MRKTIKTFLAMFLICLSSVAIFGCGAKVTKLEYVEGSMDTTLIAGEELVTTGFKAVATMSNDTQVNLTEKDVEFNTEELDLTTSGNKELEYSYKGKTDTIDIVVLPDDIEISSLVYNGTMPTEIGLGDNIDTTNFSAEVTYANGEKITLHAADVTFNMAAVDLTTTGEKHLPFTFQGKTNYVTFVVIESTEIKTFTSNVKIDYESNTADVESNQFKIKGANARPYVVGDYNDFDPRISAFGLIVDEENIDMTPKKIENVATTTKVEKLTSDSPKAYTELTEEEYDRYFDSISNINGIMNFSSDALNMEFKITITSKYYDATEHETNPSFDFVVKVVSGYNVYDAKDFSLLDNSNKDNNDYYGWNEIKTNEEIALSNNINALILHSDIELTASNIPSTVIWQQEEVKNLNSTQLGKTNLPIVGSMKDSSSLDIYKRFTNSNFKIYGNYFTVNSSKLPKAVLDRDWDNVEKNYGSGVWVDDREGISDSDATGEKQITGHTSLINIVPSSTATAFNEIELNDINFIGNGRRSRRSVNSGGHILMKAAGAKLTIDNCSHQDYFIGYFLNAYTSVSANEDQSKYVIKNSVGTNSYNTLFYVYGAKDLDIIDSEFTSAGGPAMIVDHVRTGDDTPDPDSLSSLTVSYPSNVEIIDSRVESFVTGEEPWFVGYGADSMAKSLKALDEPLFKPFGRTMTQTHKDITGKEVSGMINMVAIVKSSTAEAMTQVPVISSVTYKVSYDHDDNPDTPEIYYEYGLNCDGFKANNQGKDSTEQNLSYKAHVNDALVYVQSAMTGKYINSSFGKTNVDSNAITGTYPNLIPTGEHAQGDYINLYLNNYMGAIIGCYGLPTA